MVLPLQAAGKNSQMTEAQGEEACRKPFYCFFRSYPLVPTGPHYLAMSSRDGLAHDVTQGFREAEFASRFAHSMIFLLLFTFFPWSENSLVKPRQKAHTAFFLPALSPFSYYIILCTLTSVILLRGFWSSVIFILPCIKPCSFVTSCNIPLILDVC